MWNTSWSFPLTISQPYLLYKKRKSGLKRFISKKRKVNSGMSINLNNTSNNQTHEENINGDHLEVEETVNINPIINTLATNHETENYSEEETVPELNIINRNNNDSRENLLPSRQTNESTIGALDEISINEALNMQHDVHFALDNFGDFEFDIHIANLINRLNFFAVIDMKIKTITELNRFVLMSNNEAQIHLISAPLISVLPDLLNPSNNIDLIIQTLRLMHSIVDVFPSQTLRFLPFSSNLLHMVTTSECVDIIENIIGIFDKFCQVCPDQLLKKDALSKIIRLIDFVSIVSQKLILKIHINCVEKISVTKFHCIKNSIEYLVQRLQSQYDFDMIYLSINCLHKLMNIFQKDEKIILKIFSNECLKKFVDLLKITPSILNTASLILVLQILAKLCCDYPNITFTLVNDLKIVDAIYSKLTGVDDFNNLTSFEIDIYDKPDCEMIEIVGLISNFYPSIPLNPPFDFYPSLIESYCGDLKYSDLGYSHSKKIIYKWEYFSSNNVWKLFDDLVSTKIEIAFQNRQNPYIIKERLRTTVINFSTMEQCTLMKTFVSRIRRVIKNKQTNENYNDPRTALLGESYYKMNTWILSLLSNIIKNDISSSLAHKCLIVIIKMINFSHTNVVFKFIKERFLAREVALFLKSNSLSIVVSAIVLIKIIFEKTDEKIVKFFANEGVYEVHRQIIDTIYKTSDKNKHDKTIKSLSSNIISKQFETNDQNLILSNFRKTLLKLKIRTKKLFNKMRRRNEDNSSADIDILNHCIVGPQFLTIKDTDANAQWLELENFLNSTIIKISDSILSNIKSKLGKQISYEEKSLDFLIDLMKKIKPGEVLDDNSFDQLANLFKLSNMSILTPFQIKQSKLIQIILAILTQSNFISENVTKFVTYFINGYENDITNSPFYGLITSMQTYISYIEKLPNPTITKVTNALPTENISNLLEKKLKFALHHCCPVIFQRHSLCTDLDEITSKRINIHPLRTIASIENFVHDLCERKKGENRRVESIKASHISRQSNLIKNCILRCEQSITQLCSSMMYDKDISQNIYENVSQNERQIELLFNDVPLHSQLTLIQALATRLRSSTSNIVDRLSADPFSLESLFYGKTLCIQYRLAAKSTKTQSNPQVYKSFKLSKYQLPLFNPLSIHSSNISNIIYNFSCNKIKLGFDPMLFKSLKLLSILHYINFSWGSILNKLAWTPFLERKIFSNVSLSIKLSRLVSDQFVCLIGLFPQWVILLSELCPFLFDFNLRSKLFTATRYNFDRKLLFFQRQHPSLELSHDLTSKHTIRKEYVCVNRETLLKQAQDIFKNISTKDRILSITYLDESGFGNGPTAEYFSIVSKQIIQHHLSYWRSEGENIYEQSIFPQVLPLDFTRKHKTEYKSYFIFLGLFIGRCILDKCPIDLSFPPIFYMNLLNDVSQPHLYMLKELDPVLYNSLLHIMQLADKKDADKIKDIGLTFTYTNSQGYVFELCPFGKEIAVTISNVQEFIQSLLLFVFKYAVYKPFKWIRQGISSYFPSFVENSIFYPEEIESILCGERQVEWSINDLKAYISLKPKYTIESPVCHFLFEVLSTFDRHDQRIFLQFVTGKPRLPFGGFANLSPPLTIFPFNLVSCDDNKKSLNPDDYLPNSNTCVHAMKLPDYSTKEILKKKILFAMNEGQEAFLLS